MSATEKLVNGTAEAIDNRFGSSQFLKRNMRKVFPDHWTFLLGEVALYTFVVLILTGTFLTLFFKPSMLPVAYDGSYAELQGVEMSEAYASTLHISFDVRGGLLVRQIHHWSALIFIASICAHMLRHFFTGSYRKPREISWILGWTLLVLALVEGFAGYSLPDDLLSGTGLKTAQGIVVAIPVVGTYLSFLLFGGEYPGEDFIARLYVLHILLVPGILAALIPLHGIVLTWRLKHTQFPGKKRQERSVYGYPFYPVFMFKTIFLLSSTLAVCSFLSTFFQINPVWLYGPYNPTHVSAGAQPDWYLGFLEGGLRIMPAWEIDLWGYPLSLSVLLPALVAPGILLGGLLVYPFVERWVLKDYRSHHLLDRPRNAPTRAGIGMAGITFFGVLWAAAGNDVIAARFQVSLYATTWFFRVAIFAGPALAYYVTRRICLGLQRRDRELASHGVETGRIVQGADGEYTEVSRTLDEHEDAVARSKKTLERITAGVPDENGLSSPGDRTVRERVRARLNRAYHAGDVLPEGRLTDHEGLPTAASANGDLLPNGDAPEIGSPEEQRELN